MSKIDNEDTMAMAHAVFNLANGLSAEPLIRDGDPTRNRMLHFVNTKQFQAQNVVSSLPRQDQAGTVASALPFFKGSNSSLSTPAPAANESSF